MTSCFGLLPSPSWTWLAGDVRNAFRNLEKEDLGGNPPWQAGLGWEHELQLMLEDTQPVSKAQEEIPAFARLLKCSTAIGAGMGSWPGWDLLASG